MAWVPTQVDLTRGLPHSTAALQRSKRCESPHLCQSNRWGDLHLEDGNAREPNGLFEGQEQNAVRMGFCRAPSGVVVQTRTRRCRRSPLPEEGRQLRTTSDETRGILRGRDAAWAGFELPSTPVTLFFMSCRSHSTNWRR